MSSGNPVIGRDLIFGWTIKRQIKNRQITVKIYTNIYVMLLLLKTCRLNVVAF